MGDWVHIQNPNDVTKPVVAQIYRTWQDTEGQKWVNACWYYRPEQTVHQYEKHFYPNEVVKTGQYRDHHIDEIIDRCFVMFFTRYSRGRPRGFPVDKEVYVCEARYNEEKHKLNKIKTWASCLPDEVRDKDYEMDLFEGLRKVKKVPSPLLYMLKEDTKETGDLSKPRWGVDNAPPIVGAIHKGARDENVSNTLMQIAQLGYQLITTYSNHHHPSQHLRHLQYRLLSQQDKFRICLITIRAITVETVGLTLRWEAQGPNLSFQVQHPPTTLMLNLPTLNHPPNNIISTQPLLRLCTAISIPNKRRRTLHRSITMPLLRPNKELISTITPRLRADIHTTKHQAELGLYPAPVQMQPALQRSII